MKIGSLVVPTIDYKNVLKEAELLGYNIKISPFIPNKNTICTVKFLDNKGGLLVSETNVTEKGKTIKFTASFWREIQAPLEGINVLEEIKELQLITLPELI